MMGARAVWWGRREVIRMLDAVNFSSLDTSIEDTETDGAFEQHIWHISSFLTFCL